MENRVQMKRPVIEFFPVYKSYPKHFAGNVGLSPTLNFLGMMIFCEKDILIIFSISSREAESLKFH